MRPLAVAFVAIALAISGCGDKESDRPGGNIPSYICEDIPGASTSGTPIDNCHLVNQKTGRLQQDKPCTTVELSGVPPCPKTR